MEGPRFALANRGPLLTRAARRGWGLLRDAGREVGVVRPVRVELVGTAQLGPVGHGHLDGAIRLGVLVDRRERTAPGLRVEAVVGAVRVDL